jgi:hypothetical protein
MAKRAFLTGAMIIAASAGAHAAQKDPSATELSADRGTVPPAVSSVVRVDDDIVNLGGDPDRLGGNPTHSLPRVGQRDIIVAGGDDALKTMPMPPVGKNTLQRGGRSVSPGRMHSLGPRTSTISVSPRASTIQPGAQKFDTRKRHR